MPRRRTSKCAQRSILVGFQLWMGKTASPCHNRMLHHCQAESLVHAEQFLNITTT